VSVNYYEFLDSWIADRRVQAAGVGVEVAPPAFSYARQVALQRYRQLFMQDMSPADAHQDALEAVSVTHPTPAQRAAEEDLPAHYGRTDITYKMPLHRNGVMELELSGALDEDAGGRLAAQIRQAVADPRTESVLLRVDSPGGLLAACLGVIIELERAREAGLPTVAFVVNQAASAAAVIALDCDEVVLNDDVNGSELPASVLLHRPHSGREDMLQDGQEQIAKIIARRRGESEDRLNDLLGSGLDHTYYGRDAIREGLADSLGSIWDARGRAIALGKAVRQ
jgi:ClpP class serine protease